MSTGTAHKSIDTTDAGPHAVTTADGIDYTYDDVGNLTEADDNGTTTT